MSSDQLSSASSKSSCNKLLLAKSSSSSDDHKPLNSGSRRKRAARFALFGLKLAVLIFLLLFMFEYLLFYVSALYCREFSPSIQLLNQSTGDDASSTNAASDAASLRALILTDPHIFGKRRGYWLDRVKREWQMHVAFVHAKAVFRPNTIWFLGDLLDEGQIAGQLGLVAFASLILNFKHIF